MHFGPAKQSKLCCLQLPTGLEGQTTANTFAELVDQVWQNQSTTIRVPSQMLVAYQMTL